MTMQKVPLMQAFELGEPQDGRYPVEFAPAVCFGIVVSGGLILAAAHKAAADFIVKTSRNKTHKDVLHVTNRFFRPTLAAPKKAQIHLKIINEAKAQTTLQFEVFQNDKLCISGLLTYSMANLSAPAQGFYNTEWKLSPPALSTSIADLENDRDPNWTSYLTPFSSVSYRNAQAYVRYHIPIKDDPRHTNDQWITPGWDDANAPNGPVWTNESVHFVVDNCLPLLPDLMNADRKDGFYHPTVAAGLLQKEARVNGKDDRLWGEGMSPSARSGRFAWIMSTMSITTEIKKLLKPEGEKWLFMRATTKHLQNQRMDLEIILMDAAGELVALCNHIVQAIPLDAKMEKKPKKAKM